MLCINCDWNKIFVVVVVVVKDAIQSVMAFLKIFHSIPTAHTQNSAATVYINRAMPSSKIIRISLLDLTQMQISSIQVS